jgi:hypothetical protein
MKKPANYKNTIEQLKALQIKARNDFEKIGKDSSGKPTKPKKTAAKKTVTKKKVKPVTKMKAKSSVGKVSFWKRLFGGKPGKKKTEKSPRAGQYS